jgi:hypothetical protein
MSMHFTRNGWVTAYALAAVADDFSSLRSIDEAFIVGFAAAEEQGYTRGPLPLLWRNPVAVYNEDQWDDAEAEAYQRNAQAVFETRLAELDTEDAALIAESDALAQPIEFMSKEGYWAHVDEQANRAAQAASIRETYDVVMQAYHEQVNREALSRAFAMPQFGQLELGREAGMLAGAGWTKTDDGWERPPVAMVEQVGNVAGGSIVGGDLVDPLFYPNGSIVPNAVGAVFRDDGSIVHDSRGPGADERNRAREAAYQKGLAFSSGPTYEDPLNQRNIVDPMPTQAAPCPCGICQPVKTAKSLADVVVDDSGLSFVNRDGEKVLSVDHGGNLSARGSYTFFDPKAGA